MTDAVKHTLIIAFKDDHCYALGRPTTECTPDVLEGWTRSTWAETERWRGKGRSPTASHVSASELGWQAPTQGGRCRATTTSFVRSEPGNTALATARSMAASSSAVLRRPAAATERNTRSSADGSVAFGWTATQASLQGECTARALQDTSVATTARKRRRGVDDSLSIAHEEEEDTRVTRAKTQKSSGMTTRACTLCSCVMRQTETRKQLRNAANRHVDVRRRKAQNKAHTGPIAPCRRPLKVSRYRHLCFLNGQFQHHHALPHHIRIVLARRPAWVQTLKTEPSTSWQRLATSSRRWWPPAIILIFLQG